MANGPERTERSAGTLRKNDLALAAAVLRFGPSLDPDTVLREAVEAGRTLTGASYGVIATVDRRGKPRDFVTSGFTPGERQTLEDWADGLRLFGHLRELTAPLRLPNLDDWSRSLGCSPYPLPCGAFQATPMRFRDVAVGSFVLGGKAGGFTAADEDLLMLFGQQAAAAIVNARTHRDEQKIRADLEALIETCPVGVVVLNASGVPLLLNREARRIVAGLESEECSPQWARDEVTCRRGDGREVTLRELANSGAVQAEEVELSIPDGRSVRALIDATPVLSAAGSVERAIMTLQDLEPFEALERSRAEFLGMVSHELRAPLAAIKGSATTARDAAPKLDPDEALQFLRIIEDEADRMDSLIRDLLDAGRIGAGMLSVDPGPEDVVGLVEEARTVFTGGNDSHPVVVDLGPDLPPVMADARRIVQVLTNLFNNAGRHSPAASAIRVAAVRSGMEVEVSVSDWGEGIPRDQLGRLFHRHAGAPGQEGGGTGLGLVICKGLIEAHGGRIRAESAGPGLGTRIAFTLPAAAEGVVVGPVSAPLAPRGRAGTPVLVVDDDPHALRRTRDALAAVGYVPTTTAEPGQVARLIETKRPALVLLDLVLPGIDGIELMQGLPALSDRPVIFVSAYGRGDTVARALEAGAADYIVKPFSPAELVARVGLALRRRAIPERIVFGDLAVEHGRRRATLAGREVGLTATEYRLLHALALDAGGVTPYESLMRRVWGDSGPGNLQAVRSAVRKLRRKLGDDRAIPKYIVNVRGVGYRMPEPNEP